MDRRSLLAGAFSELLLVRSGRVTASTELLDSWDDKIVRLYGEYDRSPVASTAVQIRREMPLAQSLIKQGGYSPATTTRLHRVNARFGALLAASRHDLGAHASSAGAFSDAFYHANEARDRSLQGWIRCWQSSLARQNGEGDRAVVLARDAARWAGKGAPVAARGALMEARALASLGRKYDVHEAIGRAWTIVGSLTVPSRGTPGFAVETMHRATVAEMSAAAYLDLGHPDAAGTYAEAALPDLDMSGATGRRSLVRVHRARALVAAGEVDRGCAAVHEAMDISAERPTAALVARIDALVRDARAAHGRIDALDDIEDRMRVWALPPV